MNEVSELTEEQQAEVESRVNYILQKRKEKRVGARVFCVSCGTRKRTPLRSWHDVYICENCWKMKNAIGEDAFMKRLNEGALYKEVIDTLSSYGKENNNT